MNRTTIAAALIGAVLASPIAVGSAQAAADPFGDLFGDGNVVSDGSGIGHGVGTGGLIGSGGIGLDIL